VVLGAQKAVQRRLVARHGRYIAAAGEAKSPLAGGKWVSGWLLGRLGPQILFAEVVVCYGGLKSG